MPFLQGASWGEGLNLASRGGASGGPEEIQIPVYHHLSRGSSPHDPHLGAGRDTASAARPVEARASSLAPPVWSPLSLAKAPSCDRLFYSGPRMTPSDPAVPDGGSAHPLSPPIHQRGQTRQLETIPSIGSIKAGSSSASGPGASVGSGLGAASKRGSVVGGTPAGPGSSSGAVSDAGGSEHHQHEGSPAPGVQATVLCEADLIALATMDCSKEQQSGSNGGFWSALLPLSDLACEAQKGAPNVPQWYQLQKILPNIWFYTGINYYR